MLYLSQDKSNNAVVTNNLKMSVALNKNGLFLAQAKSDPGLATLQHSCSHDGSALTFHVYAGFHDHHGEGKTGGDLNTHN